MIVCLDMEGVLTPEIWINVGKKTGIEKLKLTTRDIPDYDALMRQRLRILRENGIKLKQIQSVIAGLSPLPGARAFLDKLRARRQAVILSDTYYEFATPLLKKLGHPTLLCNTLEIDGEGYIKNYVLRQTNGKEKAVLGLMAMGFKVMAVGDSYNDLTMLKAADRGVLFNPPPAIARENPRFPVTRTYPALLKELLREA